MSRSPTIVRDALVAARTRLPESSSAALEAELLLAHALQRPRTSLHAWPEADLPPAGRERFELLVTRRAGGEPIAYLLGRREFWSLDLEVTPDVLIPRPETEGLVEIALEHLRAEATTGPAILDLGTGSGCVAIALARERPDARMTAVDDSLPALAVARGNAERLGVGAIELVHGDWLAPVGDRRFDVILSNPPYVRSDDPHLHHGDLRFEPIAALDGGPDGLDAIRALAAAALPRLASGGLLAIEHGADQGEAVTDVLVQAGGTHVAIRRDLAGLPRFGVARGP